MKNIAAAIVALALVYGSTTATEPFLLKYPPLPHKPTSNKYLDQNCKLITKLPKTVTPAERCWINALSARCNVGDRCLASCLANGHPNNVEIGGGCWHSCGGGVSPTPLDDWKEPKNANQCRAIGKVNGI